MSDDQCGRDENAHEVIVNVEFTIEEHGDVIKPQLAVIHSHVHNVPHELAASTLLTVAHKLLADHMAHDTFESVSNHSLAHAMGRASAAAYLIEALKTMPDEDSAVSAYVPDDISSLLEGD
jgi:hypothetical protein